MKDIKKEGRFLKKQLVVVVLLFTNLMNLNVETINHQGILRRKVSARMNLKNIELSELNALIVNVTNVSKRLTGYAFM